MLMCANTEYARIIIKQGNGVPTIPVGEDHDDGSWLATDIYVGEFYQDLDTGLTYTRTPTGITQLVDSSGLPVVTTIYTGNGSINENRTVVLSGDSWIYFNGSENADTNGSTMILTTVNARGISSVVQDNGPGIGGEFIGDSPESIGLSAKGGLGTPLLVEATGVNPAEFRCFVRVGNNGDAVIPQNLTALMQLDSSTRGLLIPRMMYADKIAIVDPAPWLQVIQTNEDRGAMPGLYVFNPDLNDWDRIVMASEL